MDNNPSCAGPSRSFIVLVVSQSQQMNDRTLTWTKLAMKFVKKCRRISFPYHSTRSCSLRPARRAFPRDDGASKYAKESEISRDGTLEESKREVDCAPSGSPAVSTSNPLSGKDRKVVAACQARSQMICSGEDSSIFTSLSLAAVRLPGGNALAGVTAVVGARLFSDVGENTESKTRLRLIEKGAF